MVWKVGFSVPKWKKRSSIAEEFVTSVPAYGVKFRSRIQCASRWMEDNMELFFQAKETLPGGWIELLPSVNYFPL